MNATRQSGKRPRSRAEKLWLAFGGLLLALLLAGVFTLGSLRVPFEPDSRTEFVVLFALSTFNIVALLVFGLILARTLLRTWAERQTARLGARFKTKMVLGAMAVSLLPVIFLFWVSYALLNRTLAKWFPRPLEIAAEESRHILDRVWAFEYDRLRKLANSASKTGSELPWAELHMPIVSGADAAWAIYPSEYGRTAPLRARVSAAGVSDTEIEAPAQFPQLNRTLPRGGEVWTYEGKTYLAARSQTRRGDGTLIVARLMPPEFLSTLSEVEMQTRAYEQQKASLRTYRNMILLTLGLFTVLVLFSSMWFALFLSKQVTVPIEALAEGTREVARGNLGHQVDVQATAELGTLVSSFNQMTAQLADSRRQVDEFTGSLQQAVAEIEERRQLMEALQENIPTGVLSLDESGAVIRANSSVARIFGEKARAAKTLAGVMGDEAARSVEYLMRKSLRLGAATKELEIAMGDRVLHAAVTVSALGPRRSNPGYVVVIDDLTDLLRAQKAAAWQEVAQRIAHEIKNPLTPIQLSAQRLARRLERACAGLGQTSGSVPPASAAENTGTAEHTGQAGVPDLPTVGTENTGQAGRPVLPDDFAALARECTALIEREVATLKSLVDEFSQFARFPAAKTEPAEVNAIVAAALDVFSGRLDGVRLRTDLSAELPQVRADPELLRRVVVNLVDNAAEAMEGASAKELRVCTSLTSNGEMIEIAVADSGHGISPEDKEKLFLPHFSTRGRGTGLGLAIAARIVAEHGGAIRAEDNFPVGAKFIVRLPVIQADSRQFTADSWKQVR